MCIRKENKGIKELRYLLLLRKGIRWIWNEVWLEVEVFLFYGGDIV